MAPHAILVRHALVVEHLSHLMRLMAIDTGRQRMSFFLPQLAFDHLAMNDLDLRMALRARGRNVLACNGGSGISMRKD